ncbi:hypothetical protein B0H13DRAFT_2144210 [Mycena leptocephala]|nr:hypothetical protein B0H13DRAFT_2144210 [Mycena leptocephala]
MSTLRPFLQFTSDLERVQIDVSLGETRPDAVPEGSMMAKDFVTWVRSATSSIQEAIVTDVCWWEAKKTALRHEFLGLRMKHDGETTGKTATGGLSVLYPAASSPLVEFLQEFRLFLALTSNPDEIFPPPTALEEELATIRHRDAPFYREFIGRLFLDPWDVYIEDSWPFLPNREFTEQFIHHSCMHPVLRYGAFVDPLDEQRRGPPLRLCDLASYIDILSTTRPQYNIFLGTAFERYMFEDHFITEPTSLSCLLLRESVARLEHLAVDASTVGHVFRILRYQEFGNGSRILENFAVLVEVVFTTIGIAVSTAVIVFISTIAVGMGWWIWTFVRRSFLPAMHRLQRRFSNRLREETASIISLVEEKLGNPQVGMRSGDYEPPVIPLVKQPTARFYWDCIPFFFHREYEWHVQQDDDAPTAVVVQYPLQPLRAVAG